MAKRQVEVFTAGCPVCESAVRLVEELACPDCEVTVHDLRQPEGPGFTASPQPSAREKAAEYGIKTIPAVVVDGRLVSCCENTGPNRDALSAAGIGQRL